MSFRDMSRDYLSVKAIFWNNVTQHIGTAISLVTCIHAEVLHICDIVTVHFNHFPCMKIFDTIWSHLCVLTYIYV